MRKWKHLSYHRGSQTFPVRVPFQHFVRWACTPKHGRRRDFFQKGANSGFSRGGPKIFLQGRPKVAKLHFHHSKLRKQSFLAKTDGKMSNFKILVRSWPPLPKPMPLKLLMIKRLRKITKIYLPVSMQWFLKIIFNYFYFNILIFEPDMKSIDHKHALSAQHRLIITDTEHFVSALVVGPQE